MRIHKILLILFLFVMQSFASAQGTEPAAPWPPDPETIFEEGVQWQEIGLNSTAGPDARVDWTRPVIQVRDGSGNITREYDFPSGKDHVHRANFLPDGTIQVVVDWIEGWSYRNIDYSFVPGNVLLLDPETGLYSEAPTVCDNLAVQTQQGSPQWKAVGFHTEPRQWMVCETETGILLDILPDRFDWWTVLQPAGENWLILAGYDEHSPGDFQIFSYHLEDKVFRILGEMRSNIDNHVSLCDMISDTVGLLCVISNHHYISTAYYSFDLTQSFSVDFAFSGWPDNSFEIDQPLRNGSVFSSEYFSLISGSGIPTPSCS